ncbi:hypothetical protein AgCh_033108 [Apium graveolens]
MDKGKGHATPTNVKRGMCQLSLAESVERGRKKKESKTAKKSYGKVNQKVLDEIKADKMKIERAYNDMSQTEEEHIRQVDEGKGHASSEMRNNGEVNWYKWTESQAPTESHRAKISEVKQSVRRMRAIRAAQGFTVCDNEQFIGYGKMHFEFMESSIRYEDNINKNFNAGNISKEEHDYELKEMCRYYHFMEDELEMRKREAEDVVARCRSEKIREEEQQWDKKYAKYIVKLGDFSQGHDDAGMANNICYSTHGPDPWPLRQTRSSRHASTHKNGEGGHKHTSPYIQGDEEENDEKANEIEYQDFDHYVVNLADG